MRDIQRQRERGKSGRGKERGMNAVQIDIERERERKGRGKERGIRKKIYRTRRREQGRLCVCV